VIVLDANVLLYAYDSTSSQHVKARHWVELLLSGLLLCFDSPGESSLSSDLATTLGSEADSPNLPPFDPPSFPKATGFGFFVLLIATPESNCRAQQESPTAD
jgi:hypothetical protein